MTATRPLRDSRVVARVRSRGPAGLLGRLVAVVFAMVIAVALAACGSLTESSAVPPPPYEVVTHQVGDTSTQDISVWEPVAPGSWPVVYAVPGISGHREDLDLLGPALAAQGAVVFASDYRATGTPAQITRDLVCGYRYIYGVAPQYGGDLTKPVTAVGYSNGARLVLGLRNPAAGPTGGCSPAVPAPDVVVGINGCYFDYQGTRFPFTPLGPGDTDATVVLVTGDKDVVCPSWQSERAARELSDAGVVTSLVPLLGADHFTPVFHDYVDGSWTTDPQSAAGVRTVQVVMRAIATSP